jgi:hypothetical protein
MDVQVENNLEVEVGDVIEYKDSGRRKHPYYLVSQIEDMGYFVLNLGGKKEKLRVYKSIENLMRAQKNIVKIYSQKEWAIKIAKK